MLLWGTTIGTGTVSTLAELAQCQSTTPEVGRVIESGPLAARMARREVRDTYGNCLPSGVTDDLELIVAELVENASKVTPDGASVHLGIRPVGADLLVEVADPSELTPMRRCAADLDEGGRGLLLIEALTESWGWRHVDGAKVVWARMRLPSESSASASAPAVSASPSGSC
jgi:hypothetical protein